MGQGVDNTDKDRAQEVVRRILERHDDKLSRSDDIAQALASTAGRDQKVRGGDMDRMARQALTRVQGIRSDREEITEVEYRQIRLERVIVVGLWSDDFDAAKNSLMELASLAKTAGSHVVEGFLQRRNTPSPATYVGSGKAKEIAAIVKAENVDTIIVDAQLAPSQRRGLEDIVDAKVVDRTALILDIFAQHATSKEGKAQVELAQLTYLLPRLRGWGESMSRQAGGRVSGGAGIGSRGPGETKIELDRRRISQRMAKLRRDIKAMKKTRDMKRGRRKANSIPAVAIVGYTNAGKSSLMNRLTDADVMVDDLLFATLDTTVRHSKTPDGRTFTLTDTVGFVSNLPHELIEAFRSTLEETQFADVIVHVVDAAHPDPDGQIRTVHDVLAEVEGVSEIPELLVFNKADLAKPARLARLRATYDDAVITSAFTGEGIEELKDRIAQMLPFPNIFVDVIVPYDRGDLVSRVHDEGEVEKIDYVPEGTHIMAMVNPDLAHPLREVDVQAHGHNGDE